MGLEYKCFTPYGPSPALGHGSQRCGGAASKADGCAFAFGNTEEDAIATVFGLKAMGDPADPPLDRRTGLGRVDAVDGDYADALRKGNHVRLLLSETSGAISRGLDKYLKSLAKLSKSEESQDSTIYVRRGPRLAQDLLPSLAGRPLLCDRLSGRPHPAQLCLGRCIHALPWRPRLPPP